MIEIMADGGDGFEAVPTGTSSQASSPRRARDRSNRLKFKGVSRSPMARSAAQSFKDLELYQKAATQENSSDRSYGHRVAGFLEKIPGYYPNNTKHKYDDPNLLQIGWSFYDHITLARHFKPDPNNESDDGKNQLVRSEPGNPEDYHFGDSEDYNSSNPEGFYCKTQLYSWWKTRGSSLDDFGIGVGLYFNSMKFMAMALLLSYLASLPNVFYYYSEEYGGTENHQEGLGLSLKGSAICDNTIWVACEEDFCDVANMQKKYVNFGTDKNGQIFVEKNNCNDVTLQTGLVNLGAFLVGALVIIIFTWYQSKRQTVADEDKITASDYSIWVSNPPPDAYDPAEWREFFEQYAESRERGIAGVTVLVSNELFLKQLLIQRLLRKELGKWLPDFENFHDEKAVLAACKERQIEVDSESISLRRLIWLAARPFAKPFKRLCSPMEVYEKILETSKMIVDLKAKNYPVANVIVTFETEKGQRNALSSLSTGKLNVRSNNLDNTDPSVQFKGSVLDIMEPSEPSAIRYLDLNTNALKTFIQSMITFAITIGLVIGGGFLVDWTRNGTSAFIAGLLTSALNMLVPVIIKLLMFIEKHQHEDDRQKSLYLKVTLFRWVNTAITVKFATPLTHLIGVDKTDLIGAINGILISEIFFVPLLGMLDIMGNISKHYFAPRAKTLQQMLLCFKGTAYNIAEKYMDVTKIVFLSYYYCALNPNFLVMGCAALLLRYCTDKFCLMRTWYSAPYIGGSVAQFSRTYFFPFAIVAGIASSAFDWALFNFDRVCKSLDGTFTPGSFLVMLGDDTDMNITVNDNNLYRVCDAENCCQEAPWWSWPPVPDRLQPKSTNFEWMSTEQEDLTRIFGWTSCAAIVIFILLAFSRNLVRLTCSLFKGTYKPDGADQKIDLCNAPGMEGYIPQIRIGFGAVFPAIACDLTGVDVNLIGWNDPQTEFSSTGYNIHNLFHEMPMFHEDEDDNDDDGVYKNFSTVKFWMKDDISNDTLDENRGLA